MNRFAIPMFAIAVSGMLSAQSGNPLSTEAKQAFNGIKNNLTKMAEKMPEESYGFKAVPEIRSFGGLVGHVADSALRTCSTVAGEAKQGQAEKTMTKKAELVAALKEAFASCDMAFEGFNDAKAVEMVKSPRGERSKLGMLVGNTTHLNEEYGYMAVYLRLKGIVPPSSEGR